MKRFLLILPGFLLLLACTVYVRPAGTPPPAPVSEDAFYYTFKGQVLSENGAPMPNVGVTMEERNLFNGGSRDGRFLTAKTNGTGYFSFQVKRNSRGIIRINDALLVSESIKFRGPSDGTPHGMGGEDFSVLPEEGSAYRHVTNAGRGNAFRITVPYSDMGFAFNEIKGLYENRDYREVVYKGRFFQETFGNGNGPYVADVRWMTNDAENRLQGQMRAEFNALMALNDRRDFDSVISRGKAYINDYRGIEGSRWEEVRRLVGRAEYSRREAEYTRRDEHSMREAERDRREAERSRHEREAMERYDAILGIRETDYDAIISRGNAYIEEYGYPETGQSRRVEKMVSEAEARKRLAEERKREVVSQNFAREQAAREQVAREQAAREQVAREQVAREQAAREQAAREQAARSPVVSDRFAKDQSDKDQAARDKAAKEQADKDKAAKDKAAKDQADKDKAARDQAAKDQVARDQAARDQIARNQSSRGQAANDPPVRDRFAVNKKDAVPGAVAVAGAAPKAPAAPVNVAVAGGNIFRANCSACHGSDGNGTAIAPAFRGNGWIRNASKGDIIDTIRNGRQGPSKKYKKYAASMPNHKNMSDGDLNALADFIKSIN